MMKRCLATIVALVGVASLVLGIVFIMQANSGKQQLADDLSPLKLSEVDGRYDTVKASQAQLMAVEEPKIQTGQAQPSAMYIYLTANKIGLGLARSNIGMTSFIMTSGIVDIVMGFGLILVGVVLFKK
jgi:hypothetical protein